MSRVVILVLYRGTVRLVSEGVCEYGSLGETSETSCISLVIYLQDTNLELV